MGYLLGALAGGARAAEEVADKFMDEQIDQRRQANLERIANKNYSRQREDRLNDKASDRELMLEDEARKTEQAKELQQWQWENQPKEAKEQWVDAVDPYGNPNQKSTTTGAWKWALKDNGAGGKSGGKKGKDNIVDLPIDIGNDVKIKYNETTGEFLDPTGALGKPRAAEEDVKDIVDEKISSINSINGSDAEFEEYYRGATDKLGNPIKTEEQARKYEIEQALASTSYAAQYGIPTNKIVKQWSSTLEGEQPATQYNGEAIKVGGLTVPVPNNREQEQPSPLPEQTKKDGLLPELSQEQQRQSDIELLNSNGIDIKETEKEKRGYFELTDENGENYNPIVEAGKELIVQPRESYNAYKGAANDAVSAIQKHFDGLSKDQKRRAIETSQRAINKMKMGKPLNKLEIKAIKEVPQQSKENQSLVEAYIRAKGL